MSSSEVCPSTFEDPYTKGDDHECQLPRGHLFGRHQCGCGYQWPVDTTRAPDPLETTDEEFLQFASGAIQALVAVSYADSIEYFGQEAADDLVECTLGLAGESGEVADIVKKILRGSLSNTDPAVHDHLCEEVVDVFIYVLKATAILEFDLVKRYMEKREYNHRRFIDANGPDQPYLDANIRGLQQGTVGAAAFVSEQDLQHPVPPTKEG